jgi:multidrug efflux pump subunit AcrA (membrane-fusion protein)
MKYVYQCIISIIAILALQACSHEDKTAKSHVMSIEKKAADNTLYYTGTIQPLNTLVIPSPVDGVIVDMPFQYGEPVKLNQLLFKISSTKFLADYKTALMQYIKTKNEFNSSETQLKESDFLHKNLLISDDDYKAKQSSFYAARLALLQAKDALEVLLHQLDVKNINLYTLSIADIDKITQALHLQENSENILISSIANGIVLASTKNEEESKKIRKGDAIKQGDVLAVIGDMSGISVRIKANELTINQLKIGQPVQVTGIAFPSDILQGKVKRLDRQGETANGGLPTFAVEIEVPKLTAAQQRYIHAGMSAKVTINLEEEPQIMVPMVAVSEKNGESYVQLQNNKTGKTEQVAVKTGKTTMDSVAILAGLKMGDHIVIPN